MKLKADAQPTTAGLEVTPMGARIIVRWNASVHDQLNYADEDLWLLVRDANTQEGLAEARVNGLVVKDVPTVPDCDIETMLLVRERPQVSVSTSLLSSPRVVMVPENPQRHHITWSEIDWAAINRELGVIHGVSLSEDCEVVLDVHRWPSHEPEHDRQYPGMKDYALVIGPIKELNLSVVRKADQKPLKTLFSVTVKPQTTRDVLGHVRLHVPPLGPHFTIDREVTEETLVLARAHWKLDPSVKLGKDDELLLQLWDLTLDGEFDPRARRVVTETNNWFFRGLRDGHRYEGRLLRGTAGQSNHTVVAVTPVLDLPARPAEISLLPIDPWHAYCYWHLNPDEIMRRLGGEGHRVETYVRVFTEFDGHLHHHMELDFGFHMAHTFDWFMSLWPDKTYRVQVIAVIDGWRVEELTALSNPTQTGREHPGGAPVVYREVTQPRVHPTVRDLGSIRGTAERSMGQLIYHLHAHMPFLPGRINYGTSGFWRPGGYPEEWYHEAVRSTYIPLIECFDRLINEGVDFKMSMDLSPTVTAMMRSPVLQDEFITYIDKLAMLARAEVERTRRDEPWFLAAAQMHLSDFLRCKDVFLGYQKDLTRAFRKFQDMGVLEISTCAATHGFLPIWNQDPAAVRGQIHTAVLDYEDIFGRRPQGIWLPECAYTPGLEQYLQAEGLRYFFSETETVNRADAHAEWTWHAPIYVRGSDVAVFPRDYETGRIVWSADEGYPGDPDYLEFHIRGGPFKYNRITDRKTGRWKQPYNPDWARSKAAQHAQHFMENRNFRFEYLKGQWWKKPLSVACYDAELFGHHWYEGPLFLYYLLKKLYYDQDQTELVTPSQYLANNPTNQEMIPNTSSWGEEGTFKKWMGGNVVWIYRQGHEADGEMTRISKALRDGHGRQPVALRLARQAARELLLSQNSDVPFVISNGHFVDRMRQMTIDNLDNFWKLAGQFWRAADGQEVDDVLLRSLEYDHNIFPSIDPTAWA